MPLKRKGGKGPLSPEEEAAKLKELRDSLGPLKEISQIFCTDSCLYRYLRANNWSLKKSRKMLKETIKWRESYRPEKIKWVYICKEAETGKVYRADFCDKEGRTVLVMRPGVQNTNQLDGQIKYLVYCMENAILNLPSHQEQMVWLADFEGWNMSMIPVMTAKETAHILQSHYPERLAYAILYNPPKIFESFFNLVKPFLDPKTQKKVKFVYPKEEESDKLMESCFDVDKLESAFGGRSGSKFDKDEYAKIMREDDIKMFSFWQVSSNLNVNGEKTTYSDAGSNGLTA
ncbi:hypothetical protein KP509_05G061600 [Ceratopteris richardii]|uniref:CRAL-TRIO domain-containing protein n=1 Tax=Ceratopteris richardii TaxID=49495 RepID=A0A8T2URJ3_CERRI|nr:hypothetical protein KP509_05G061600 [Ceratopteris richardii]